jgi:hypothetical protein
MCFEFLRTEPLVGRPVDSIVRKGMPLLWRFRGLLCFGRFGLVGYVPRTQNLFDQEQAERKTKERENTLSLRHRARIDSVRVMAH